MEKTIEIPEGYEARIEGNKVILEKKENEDERIRSLLVWQVHRNIEDETNDLAGSVYDGIKGHDPDLEESIEDWKKCLAYLERQKEQKPVEWSETDKLHLNNAILVAKKEWGVNSYTARFLEDLRDNYKKCNSRWKPSDEQMEILWDALAFLKYNYYENAKELESLYSDLEKL